MDQTAGNDSTNVLSTLLKTSAFSSITMCPACLERKEKCYENTA